MLKRRRPAESIWKRQLASLSVLLSGLVCSLLLLTWLVQQSSSVSPVSVQQQTAQAPVLPWQKGHRLALGQATHGSVENDERQVKAKQLHKLPRLPPHAAAESRPADVLQDFGSFDLAHLTAKQASLLNAALARQAQGSYDMTAELEAKKRERARARKEAKLHLINDHDNLKIHMTSPGYSAWQDERRSNMSGRGIVISAGGPIQLANAYATLLTLREHLECTLPVELFYSGSSELDDATMRFFQERLSEVTFIDGSQLPFPAHQRHVIPFEHAGWTFKAFALYSTSFQQVLSLDADCLPLQDPDYLFSTLAFQQHGSLFWPDYWDTSWMNPAPAYRLLNVKSPWIKQPDILTTESGQFLLDRDKHVDVLEWILFLNMYGDIMYGISWGDKDLYRLAFTLAGQADHFSQVEHRPADAILRSSRRTIQQYRAGSIVKVETYRHAAMVQLDPQGAMAFFHRTSDAKLDPDAHYAPDYSIADFVTVPINSKRAAALLGGSLIYGPNGVSEEQTSNCSILPDRSYMQNVEDCSQLDLNATQMPVPVWPLVAFPDMAAALLHSFAAFLELQACYNASAIQLGRP